MMLYILRHAEAEDLPEHGNDATRHLTPRGLERTQRAAAGMRASGLKFDAILTSPLARAAETAQIVSEVYENSPPPQVLPELATGIAPTDAVNALGPFAKLKSVMIVGHEPQLSNLASLLIAGSSDIVHLRLKKGSLIALDLPTRFERGGAELHWMLTARQLGKLRK